MRAKGIMLVGMIAGPLAWGALTPDRVQQDIEAANTVALYERAWGLVCPETSVPAAEIKTFSGAGHPDLVLLPDGARGEDGALVFTLGDKTAALGAWNCENRLHRDRRPDLGQTFDLEVEFEQTGPGPTVWTLVPWYDGTRTRWGTAFERNAAFRRFRCELEGAGPHVIRMDTVRVPQRKPPPFDGVEFEIKGPAGTDIRLRRITASHKTRVGGFRKEFTLPDGPVWRAVGNVNRKTLLFVNGREVPGGPLNTRPHAHYTSIQQMQEVDLKPFLQPGTNVVAVMPAFPTDANALIQATVVMNSGETLTLDTDPTWRYVPACEDGWTSAGFAGTTEPIPAEPGLSSVSLPTTLAAIRGGCRLHMQETHGQPAYDGRLLLLSPDDNQLYFSESRPFRALARCPAGLAGRAPTIEWMLCRYRPGAALESALTGTAAPFTPQGDSIECELTGGDTRLPMGVYVLKAVLRAGDGQVLEDRIPEPCIVTGRLPMTPTPGNTFEDGLDLEPETVLDFTKPDDPAFPWMEMAGTNLCAEPLVVTRNGLTYRETRTTSHSSLIVYNYEFKHPGDFYLMELDYPDDAPRFFGVCLCSEHDGPGDHSKAGPSVWTGLEHLNTGTMQTLRWLFRPDPGYTSITLINMLPTQRAAASALRIRRVRGRLPELQTAGAERRFGIFMEHSGAGCGFAKTFRSSASPKLGTGLILHLGRQSDWATHARSNAPVRVRLESLAEWLDTSTRYAEYQRWAGQNLIFLSFYTYSGFRAEAGPLSLTGDGRLVFNVTDIAARVFRDNGIDFFSSIGYCSDAALLARYDRASAELSDSPRLINSDGEEAWVGETGFNFNHPAVRDSMHAVAGEAVRKFQRLSNFRGVSFATAFNAPMQGPNYFVEDRRHKPVDPLRFDYSDATVARFEKDTGIRLPVPADAPDRFQQRYALLTAEALRETWIEWRARNMLAFFLEMRDTLRAIKPDVKVVTTAGTPDAFFQYADSAGISDEQAMREFGWDYRKFHGQEGLYTMPWLSGSRGYAFTARYTPRTDTYEGYLRGLRANTAPAHVKIGDGALERMIMVHYGWLELERIQQQVLPERPRWQVPFQYTMEGSPQGDAALEPFLTAMAAVDPDSVLYGFTDVNLKIGNEQPLREWIRFLRSLPKAKFAPCTGPDNELVVRTLSRDGELLFYALNPAPWPVRATLRVAGAERITNLLSGEAVSGPAAAVVIPAYHGVSFSAAGSNAAVIGWHTEGAGDLFPRYVTHMTDRIQQVETRMADPALGAALQPDQAPPLHRLLEDVRQALAHDRPASAWQQTRQLDFIWLSYLLERQARWQAESTGPDRPPPILTPRTIAAPRADTPPVLDGRLDDPVWAQADPQTGFMDKDGASSFVGTEVRMAWDATNLYLGFECRDRFPDQVRATAKTEQEVLQGDDTLVFLLQPDRETTRHYQMAFNAAGAKFDQQDYDYAFAPDWKVAIRAGTHGWTAEVAFPFAALEAAPAAGARWGANFCRQYRMNRVPYSMWNHTRKGWHHTAGYGVLEFQ